MITDLALAALAAFFAGFVDSMVGGGGLIQLPALMLLFPSLPFADVSSVNKTVSLAGTTVAMFRYLKHVKPEPGRMVPGALAAFLASCLGAFLATKVSTDFMRPLVVVVLAAVATYTFMKKDLGSHVGHPSLPGVPPLAKILLVAGGVGLYDGFFGPGTGSFFVFLLVILFGLDFLRASAEAKILNVGTNVAAVLTFGLGGHFLPHLFIPLAVCNMAGSMLGTRVALKHGAGFVRKLFLCVVTALLVRLVYDLVQ